jgi:hypothetical protein
VIRFLIALLLVAPAASAQIVPYATPHPGVGRRGLDPVVPATLDDLAQGRHDREVVRVRGQLVRLGMDDKYRELREGGTRVLVIVVGELDREVRSFLGRRVEVVGFVRQLVDDQGTCRSRGQTVPSSFCLDNDLPPTPDLQGRMDWPRVSITIWSVADDFASLRRGRPGDAASRLADLLAAGDTADEVVVVGRFCGAGLCGQPPSAPPEPRAWLLQDGETSIWVVGREAKGSGWRLDPAYAADSARWLEVTGRLARCSDTPCLRAKKVAIAPPPQGETDPPVPR